MGRFQVGKFVTDDFVYTGVTVGRDKDGNTHLGQTDYIHRLREIELEKERCSKKKAAASCGELTILRRLLGALTWVGAETRPDVAAEVSRIQGAIPGA